jgi:hypothetical protein
VIIPHTFVPNQYSGSTIAFVIDDVLMAAIIAHHSTTIPKSFNIKPQTTHNQSFHTAFKNHVASSPVLDAAHITFKVNLLPQLQIVTVLSFQLTLTVFHDIDPVDSQEVKPVHTTYIKSIPKLSASIVYTGTIAKAINSFKLNFAKNQSHQSFLSKKYINQKTGEIIM